METVLELQRQYHEERERLMDSMIKEAIFVKSTTQDQLVSDHRMKMLLDHYLSCTQELTELYEDKDGIGKEEIESLSGPNEFHEFYNRMKALKDFHHRHPGEISVPLSVKYDELNKAREAKTEEVTSFATFTDEEGGGHYLDLHEHHVFYSNLKGVTPVDYLAYLTRLDALSDIAQHYKKGKYRRYLLSLLDYLEDYLRRVRPLLDIEKTIAEVLTEFGKQWNEGNFPGWPKSGQSVLAHSGAHLDLSAFSSSEQLASLGLDRLKSALLALGLKCGGTLEERADRLFATKGKRLSDLPSSFFSHPHNKIQKSGSGKQQKDNAKQKDTAMLEAQVYRFLNLLSDQRNATRDNVQRKQALTSEERGAASDEEGGGAAAELSDGDDSEDEDDVPYNPKNLPLGWDGKPIPYWLYKLHGLNISYSCEICGNYTYKGPKTFQRHFSERRHAHGMKCLKIPNTAHFANVTSIEDALTLWEKIKDSKESERWKPDAEEEFEDSRGNVINRKTYEDMKKQGVL